MTLKFHNTLTGNVDEFVPITSGKVTMYTCGPTVYNSPHIGNWSSYIYWDVLVRILQANNYVVDRVMNITDVGHLTSDADDGEDKLEKGARREGMSTWDTANKYMNEFLEGMKQLNMTTPNHITRATEFIDEQIDFVRKLKQKNYTYQIDDGIYFDTSKFPTYADFAHLRLGDLKAGTRVEYNFQKKNPCDFAIWKFTPKDKKRDMEWETPGDLLEDNKPRMGFPGWHLECSTMAMAILGDTIDIHTGGIDHIPVHHTNEIAQSESVTGKIFSNYWLHNNHIKVNGTKISKSLQNGYTLDYLKEKGFSPIDFRMFILQGHYRNEGNFTFEALRSAKNRLNNWRNIAALRHQIHDTIESDLERNKNTKTIATYATPSVILNALNNDIGTPEALKIIDETFSNMLNTSLLHINAQTFCNLIMSIDSLLGLELINSTPDIPDEQKQLILERKNAREQKDWQKADEVRNKLLESGVVLRDNDNETIWEYIN